MSFPLRDRAEVERQEPNLELKKKVLAVNGGAASNTVKGGDKVKFGIELPNTTGTLKAEEIEVWDELPTGLECGVNVAEISNEGECSGTKRIVWKPSAGISVEAGKTGGPLTYVATIPVNVAPGHKYENTAGVVNFKSKTNTGGQFTYIPENNINPAAGTPNTGPAKATAAVTTAGASVTKTATTETTQEGNNASQATIGETVKYTVTAKVPKNSVLYETATLRDEIPSGLELLSPNGQATLKLGSEESPAGFTVTEVKEGAKVFLQVNFPETFTTGATESEVVLTFKAKVRNIAANVQGTVIKNKAKLAFHDKEKASRSAETTRSDRNAGGRARTEGHQDPVDRTVRSRQTGRQDHLHGRRRRRRRSFRREQRRPRRQRAAGHADRRRRNRRRRLRTGRRGRSPGRSGRSTPG